MKVRIFQKGFNYSQDGPGNRLVWHLAGCSLQCPWCSNPEGKDACAGTELTVEELVAESLRCRPMFFDGGGVTLTGGEVTEQFDALQMILKSLKEHDVHTCIETNGTHPLLPSLFPFIDYLIMDCKHYDKARYSRIIGGGFDTVIKNLEACKKRQVALRIPLIGGFNSRDEDAFGFVNLFKAIESENMTVELLPYHEYGKDKYEKLGLTYTVTEDAKVSPMQVEKFAEIIKNAGIKLIKT